MLFAIKSKLIYCEQFGNLYASKALTEALIVCRNVGRHCHTIFYALRGRIKSDLRDTIYDLSAIIEILTAV